MVWISDHNGWGYLFGFLCRSIFWVTSTVCTPQLYIFFNLRNVVLVNAQRTLRRVVALVSMSAACEMNDMLLSLITPSVVAVLVQGMSVLLSVIVGRKLYSFAYGDIRN